MPCYSLQIDSAFMLLTLQKIGVAEKMICLIGCSAALFKWHYSQRGRYLLYFVASHISICSPESRDDVKAQAL